MKKLYVSVCVLLLASLTLNSCGGKEKTEDNTTAVNATDYTDFQGKSLKEFGIPALIMLPDQSSNVGASIEPEINHTDGDYKWELKVGPNFTLLIEDFGKEKDLIAREKKRLADFPFYNIEYIEDSSNVIFYKQTLKYKNNGNKDVGVDHTSYHCYAIKEINGITYVLRSPDEGYHKPIIEIMLKTIRSMEKL
jgi:hypothetical protein